MQITAQHAAAKKHEEAMGQATVIAIQADALPPKPTAVAVKHDKNAMITNQTVVLLSVLALLALALFPFVVLRLSIVARIFDGLSPNEHLVHSTHAPTHLPTGSIELTTAAYQAPTSMALETTKLALTSTELPSGSSTGAPSRTPIEASSGSPASSKTAGVAASSDASSRLSSQDSSRGPSETQHGLLMRRIAAALH